MRIIHIWTIFLVWSITSIAAIAQPSSGGIPPSFAYPLPKNRQIEQPLKLSKPLRDLAIEDTERNETGGLLRVSTLIDVNYSPKTTGQWITLPSGVTIWQQHVIAPDAQALMIYYSDFLIPEGAALYIYNIDRTHLLGAYTHATNPQGGAFATEFIAGDHLILEYVAPQIQNSSEPRIDIEAVGYGYAYLEMLNQQLSTRATSQKCEVDINCEEGEEWQLEKKGVCKLLMRIGNGNYLCSGSLINNTNMDATPYILSANHCLEAGRTTASASNLLQWIFYFNNEKKECASTEIYQGNTMTGCEKIIAIALKGGTDGLMLKLTKEIPDYYDIFYNGWDLDHNPSPSGVGIHHPNGDVKKISTYNTPLKTTTWDSDPSEYGLKDAHWDATFRATANGHGVTEGGSSGSPLFNNNKLIVGTLTGGDSDCSSLTYRHGSNIYGKFAAHWEWGITHSNAQISSYLDPMQKGITQLRGCSYSNPSLPPHNINILQEKNSVTISWLPPQYYKIPHHYAIYRNDVAIAESTNLTYIDQLPVVGSNKYAVMAIYEDGSRSNLSSYNEIITCTDKESMAAQLSIYPNPVKTEEIVTIATPIDGEKTIAIINPRGGVEKVIYVRAPLTTFSAPSIPGVYIIQYCIKNCSNKEFKLIVK